MQRYQSSNIERHTAESTSQRQTGTILQAIHVRIPREAPQGAASLIRMFIVLMLAASFLASHLMATDLSIDHKRSQSRPAACYLSTSLLSRHSSEGAAPQFEDSPCAPYQCSSQKTEAAYNVTVEKTCCCGTAEHQEQTKAIHSFRHSQTHSPFTIPKISELVSSSLSSLWVRCTPKSSSNH